MQKPKFMYQIKSRDGQRVFILKRDSSQTSLKAKFSFYLKKLIPFVEFASGCSVKWTEGILRIHCEVDDLVSASFASPVVGFPLSSKLPKLLSPDPLQEGCRKWMEAERQYSTKALHPQDRKVKCESDVVLFVLGQPFHWGQLSL